MRLICSLVYGNARSCCNTACSMEGWASVMYALMDSVGDEVWIYFVSIVVFMAFLVVTLFVSVITYTFSETRASENRASMFTDEEYVFENTSILFFSDY